ncbi:MAG: methyl-accepting chemotaxis protein [Hyphomicrobium sp.]|jgi:methyl-accepting chemotaxis protein
MFQKLRARIPVALVGLGLIGASAMAWIGWSGAEDGLQKAAFERLSVAAQSRRTSLELIAERLRADTANLANQKSVRDNVADLIEILAKPENAAGIVKVFTSAPPAERAAIDGASSGTMYGLRHSKLHPALLEQLAQGHYEDILLLSAEGQVVYTAKKGQEFGQWLGTPDLAGSGLETLFASLQEIGDKDVAFQDFTASTLADGAPAAFVAVPIVRKSNVAMDRAQEDIRVAYAVIRLAPTLFDRVFGARDGLGETGETFAIGPDQIIRTNAPLAQAPTAGKPAADMGIAESTSKSRIVLHEGKNHLVSETDASLFGTRWKVYAEQTADEALIDVAGMSKRMGLAFFVILVAQVLIGWLVARTIVGPITLLTGALKIMATGQSVEISGMQRSDEIGDIARAVDQIRAFTEAEAVRRAETAETERREREAQRRQMTANLAHEFEERVGTVVKSVATAAGELERSALEMAKLADESKTSSSKVASASNTANHEVQAVAAASEELSASIREVASLSIRSGTIASEAGKHAERTNEIVASLADKASRIQNVVDMIKAIADQTNLLALNATIEAARAGETGKGFAVVASEVKALASQTAKATDEIGAQIGAVGSEVSNAVEAVNSIRGVVADIGHAVISISAAIEEQTAATAEIAKSAMSAAGETSTVTGTINEVSIAIGSTDKAAYDVVGRARALGKEATDLSSSLRQFLDRLLAA